jgi:hypothetical protein
MNDKRYAISHLLSAICINEETMQLRKFFLFSLIIAAMLAACNNQPPIDTSNPINFKHRTGVFSMQAPKSWLPTQDELPTETIAAFADTTHRAELIGYAGLLDHQLGDEEGLTAGNAILRGLLNQPPDLKITDRVRRPDGAFFFAFTFTRANAQRSGQAIFRDSDLALSGVVVNGASADWPDLQKALQPYVDSFKLNKDFVQGTYFVPLDMRTFSVVVPDAWTQQRTPRGNEVEVRSPTGRFSIIGAQKQITDTLDEAGLANQALTALKLAYKIDATLSDTSKLPDGRLKLGLDRTDRHTVGYVEQKDGYFIGLFFDVPAAQLSAYQPMIDFIYSTLVTGVVP